MFPYACIQPQPCNPSPAATFAALPRHCQGIAAIISLKAASRFCAALCACPSVLLAPVPLAPAAVPKGSAERTALDKC